jgi:antirestriction protein ArdC
LSKHPNTTRRDVYQSVTDQIIEEFGKGIRPWLKPWSTEHMAGRVLLPLRHNGIGYRGVNILSLWMAALAKGCRSPIWMTFKQALDLGGAVRLKRLLPPCGPKRSRAFSLIAFELVGAPD